MFYLVYCFKTIQVYNENVCKLAVKCCNCGDRVGNNNFYSYRNRLTLKSILLAIKKVFVGRVI